MKWLVLGLFAAMPLLAFFAGWQARLLFLGRPARLNKQLLRLSPEGFRAASRHYSFMCSALAIALLALSVTVIYVPLPFSTWSQVLTIVCSVVAIWSWLLNRRYVHRSA
jgi:hypothetical protein